MVIREGATHIVLLKMDDDFDISLVDSVIFTLKGKTVVTKEYPDDVSYANKMFSIALTQEDTILLVENNIQKVEVQGQINFSNKAVSKSEIYSFFIKKSLATKIISGNAPTPTQLSSIEFKINGDVVVASVNVDGVEEIVENAIENSETNATKEYVDDEVDKVATDVLHVETVESVNKFNKTSTEVVSGYTFFTDDANNRYDSITVTDADKQTIYNASATYTVTNKIACKEGDVIRLYSGWTRCRFFDENGKADNTVYSVGTSEVKQLTAPKNAKYCRVAFSTSIINSFMVTVNATMPSTYIPYSIRQASRFDNLEIPLNGVKWTVCGDSLSASSTLADQTDKKNYVDFVSENLGLVVTNKAVGGSGYLAGGSNSIPSQCNSIPLDSEIVTLFGSFNDYTTIASNLGQLGDTDTTVYGRIHVAISKIYERCPDAIVGVITPTKWGYLSEWVDSAKATNCELYVKALIDTCNKWSIPCLDLYHESGLRPWNESFREKYYKNDDGVEGAESVHPLSNAHKKYIAPKVEDFIKKIYGLN